MIILLILWATGMQNTLKHPNHNLKYTTAHNCSFKTVVLQCSKKELCTIFQHILYYLLVFNSVYFDRFMEQACFLFFLDLEFLKVYRKI